MPYGNPVAVKRAKCCDSLRSERDFGHENDDLSARGYDLIYCRLYDVRFSASRYSVKKRPFCRARVDKSAYLLKRLALMLGEDRNPVLVDFYVVWGA